MGWCMLPLNSIRARPPGVTSASWRRDIDERGARGKGWRPLRIDTTGNREKRGFGFEIVEEFDWASAHIEEDLRKDYGERRFRAFGTAGDLKIALAFTLRGDDIRIISVRRMHDKEARKYGI